MNDSDELMHISKEFDGRMSEIDNYYDQRLAEIDNYYSEREQARRRSENAAQVRPVHVSTPDVNPILGPG